MATYNRAASGMGYTGYPARIFFEMTNYGKGTQLHLEKLTILDKWFSHLRAFLPVLMEKDQENYEKYFFPPLCEVDQKLKSAWAIYSPTMEGMNSCNPDEKEFILFMRGIFIDLDEITANAKVIDKEKIDDGLMKV
ncbi:MAG: hypothetical protein MUO73_08900 [Thermoplasmata archaeon]|nr:hypothetical protein [Thermoplasmata archaeon]